jgi:hypothetical protein
MRREQGLPPHLDSGTFGPLAPFGGPGLDQLPLEFREATQVSAARPIMRSERAPRTAAGGIQPPRTPHNHALHIIPHVGVAGRQPYPHAARNRNHGSVSSPRMIGSRLSTSTSQSTITRRPFTLTISIRRQPSPVTFSGCSGTITAGTNPAMSPSRPSRYALRQANSSWLEIPCRRAVADASRGAEKLCGRPSTAATCVNNFKPTDMASVSKVIHTDNQLHAGQFGKTAYTDFQLPTILAPIAAPNPISVRRDRPRHITMFPGGGSLARARYPPNLAILIKY